MDKKHLRGLKNLRKTILSGLEANLDKNLTLDFGRKKKSPNLHPNTETFDIFEREKKKKQLLFPLNS
jgi:hypothetical protein